MKTILFAIAMLFSLNAFAGTISLQSCKWEALSDGNYWVGVYEGYPNGRYVKRTLFLKALPGETLFSEPKCPRTIEG
jgi:hypothetical protein